MRSYFRIAGVFYWPALLAFLSVATSLFAVSPEDYLPLREGDAWVMYMTIVAPSGQKFTATGHRKVGEKVERDGKTYNQVRTWIENGPFPLDETKLMRKDANGLHSLDPQWKEQKEQTEIVLPLKIGQTWQRMNGPQMLNEKVIALETVTIGEKIYENCYRIRTEATDGQLTEEYWEAPGLGAIKSDSQVGGARFRLTLREFKPGKP